MQRVLALISLLAVAPASIFTLSSLAVEYEVHGTIEQTNFNWDGGIGSATTSRFAVFVRDASWLIQTTWYDHSGEPFLTSETACADGTQIYEVHAPVKRALVDWNIATVLSNNVPVGTDEGYFVCHLWLMFASSSYFAGLSTNWLTPVYDSNASIAVDPELKRQAKWELINGPGSLPLSVVYLGRDESCPTNATYRLTGLTNAGAVQIPSGFVFERRVSRNFAPGPTGPGALYPDYGILKRAVAKVTATKPFCSPTQLAATAKGATMVIDRQLGHQSKPVMFYPPEKFISHKVGDKLVLEITGKRGHSYVLQSTANLTPPIYWHPVWTNSADANGHWGFTVTNLMEHPDRFYRVGG